MRWRKFERHKRPEKKPETSNYVCVITNKLSAVPDAFSASYDRADLAGRAFRRLVLAAVVFAFFAGPADRADTGTDVVVGAGFRVLTGWEAYIAL